MELEKLDNPVWYSLTESHREFAGDYQGSLFYHPQYCPFGGYTNAGTIEAAIDAYVLTTDNFYVVGDKPRFSRNVRLQKELSCNQMLADSRMTVNIVEHIIELQTKEQKTDLFNIVNLVQSGYFKNKTADLGSYYGIYKDDQLVAVTGERMKMNHYTEVSAVVTHPGHTGKGYATQLLAFACAKIFDQGKVPYLHVAATNRAAIKLYEKLGFRSRRQISFWNFTANAGR